MELIKKLRTSLLLLAGTVIFSHTVFSQSALGTLESMTNTRVSIPAASGPMRVGSAPSAASAAKSVLNSSSSSISSVVAGAVMQGLLNNLLSPTPQKSQAEIDAEKAEAERVAYEAEMARQAEEARQQELHDNLINSSKTLSGSESLDFKSLDSDMETMRKTASDPFDQGNSGSSIKTVPRGNNFFGEPLSDPDFETVIEPETNPVVQDVEKAVDLTDKYLENEKLEKAKLDKEKLDKEKLEKEKLVVDIIGGVVANQAKGEPIIEKPDCNALSDKLARYKSDMIRFQEWNTGTLTELKKWEDQNNDAFWNAVKDGAGAAFGVFVDYLNDTRASASGIKKILEDNEEKYIRDGVFSTDQISRYKKLLDQRITLCNITELAKESMKPWDYVNLSRNLLQGTTEKLAKSDGDCMEIVNVLKGQGYLSDTPWVDAGQFLAGEAINKFLKDPGAVIKPNSLIKGSLKIPYVTIAQLAVDEAYNVTDMLTSFKNIITLRDADGKASEAVKKIQNDMDNIKIQLKGCPLQN
ncbi:MAG: hypothetical protein LLG13_04000 [Bacteroidales bacterium]|nr:hypothetical protein [Bacteroidales bacterium]